MSKENVLKKKKPATPVAAPVTPTATPASTIDDNYKATVNDTFKGIKDLLAKQQDTNEGVSVLLTKYGKTFEEVSAVLTCHTSEIDDLKKRISALEGRLPVSGKEGTAKATDDDPAPKKATRAKPKKADPVPAFKAPSQSDLDDPASVGSTPAPAPVPTPRLKSNSSTKIEDWKKEWYFVPSYDEMVSNGYHEKDYYRIKSIKNGIVGWSKPYENILKCEYDAGGDLSRLFFVTLWVKDGIPLVNTDGQYARVPSPEER